jgi:hypothetical protein
MYAVVLRLVIFIYPHHSDDNQWLNPLSDLLNRLIGLNKYEHLIHDILSVAVVFTCGLIITGIINHYKLIERAGYMPALIFILSASFINEFCELTPALCGFFFLQFSFITLIKMYKTDKAGGHMFNAGFFIGVASLFYLPYLSFIVFLIGGYVLSRPFVLRELFSGLLGILIPLYFAGVVYFLNDSFRAYLHSLLALYNIEQVQQVQATLLPLVIRLGSLLLLFLIASLSVRSNYNKMVMQNRIIITLCFVFFFSGACSTLFIQDNDMSHFIWLALPFTFLVSIFMAEFRKARMAEVLHLCLLLLVFYFQYLY